MGAASSWGVRAGRWRRESHRLGGAVIAVGLHLGVLTWAAPPQNLTDEEIKDAQDFFAYEKAKEYNNVPNKGPFPELLDVAGTTLIISNDLTDPKIDQRKDVLIEAVELMAKQGYLLPPEIGILFSKTPTEPGWTAQAWAVPPTPSLAVLDKCLVRNYAATKPNETVESISAQVYNETFKDLNSESSWPSFCDPASTAKAQKAGCVATLVHEICHILHAGQSPQDFYWGVYKQNAINTIGGWADVSDQVSNYSGKKRNEFVAEVCAGLILGYTYSSEVMNAYAALGGPVSGVAYNLPAPAP